MHKNEDILQTYIWLEWDGWVSDIHRAVRREIAHERRKAEHAHRPTFSDRCQTAWRDILAATRRGLPALERAIFRLARVKIAPERLLPDTPLD